MAHAALAFAIEHPAILAAWNSGSGVLALLTVQDELALLRLTEDAVDAGCACTAFCEPDLGGSLTAAALEPRARVLTRKLPLAFPSDVREEVRT